MLLLINNRKTIAHIVLQNITLLYSRKIGYCSQSKLSPKPKLSGEP